MISLLNYWLYLYQVWLIIAVIFLLLELTDGSLIVFLPTGIGAALMSLLVYIWTYFNGLSLDYNGIQWYLLILIWAFISVLMSIILSKLWKKGSQNTDINDY